MNNNFKFLLVCVLSFVIGIMANNFALSDMPTKIAIVDVPQVVNASAQVVALKKDQEKKANELVSFIEKARKDVASATDVKKKQTLEEKYSKELLSKKDAMEKAYALKLAEIDKSISKQIETQAKNNGYDIVLAKSVVLYGGEDITEAIKKAVK